MFPTYRQDFKKPSTCPEGSGHLLVGQFARGNLGESPGGQQWMSFLPITKAVSSDLGCDPKMSLLYQGVGLHLAFLS